jgi:hypothetical protein
MERVTTSNIIYSLGNFMWILRTQSPDMRAHQEALFKSIVSNLRHSYIEAQEWEKITSLWKFTLDG